MLSVPPVHTLCKDIYCLSTASIRKHDNPANGDKGIVFVRSKNILNSFANVLHHMMSQYETLLMLA